MHWSIIGMKSAYYLKLFWSMCMVSKDFIFKKSVQGTSSVSCQEWINLLQNMLRNTNILTPDEGAPYDQLIEINLDGVAMWSCACAVCLCCDVMWCLMSVCLYVCLHVSMCMYLCVSVCLSVSACLCKWVSVCMFMLVYLCLHACKCVCLYINL